MSAGTQVVEVATPEGPGRLHVDPVAPDRAPTATLVLGHGAGGGVNAMDLDLLARRLPPAGITVVRFEQPWRVAGRRVAVPPPRLDVGWRAAIPRVLAQPGTGGLLLFGGRSAGARVACRTASHYEVAGVVCLAFPLHLPGRPERSRLPELLTPVVPRLVLQGTKDAFGTPTELREGLSGDPGVVLVELPNADHGYRLPARSAFTPANLRDTLVASVIELVAALDAGDAPADRSDTGTVPGAVLGEVPTEVPQGTPPRE